ncbi:MAG: 7TM diverse intracellular signaling domain-containing protein [Bacteroidota bacterium]
MKNIYYSLLLLLPFFVFSNLFASESTIEINSTETAIVNSSVDYFIDSEGKFNVDDIINSRDLFNPMEGSYFGSVEGSLWYKLRIKNNTGSDEFFVELPSALINSVNFYQIDNGKIIKHNKSGLDYPFSKREVSFQNTQFSFYLAQDSVTDILLEVSSDYAITYPLVIGEFSQLSSANNDKDIWIVIYATFMLAMILYNFFIYISIRDISYMYYVLYTVFILLTQLGLEGIFLRYFGENPSFNTKVLVVLSSLSGFFFIFFADNFLKLKIYGKRLRKGYLGLLVIYMLALIFVFVGKINMSTQLLDLGGAYGAIFTLLVAIMVLKKGFKPAGFFLVSWIVFLVGITIYVMKNQGLLEFNMFTNHTLQIGTVIEVMLLSFALADRINLLKKEKAKIQKQQLDTLAENQRIIAEQNVILEEKVQERTEELETTNFELNKTMENLQSAQIKLIEQEKMASLGQLTAGIAHEINNPINFVLSNIKPLSQDVSDIMEVLKRYKDVASKEMPENVEYLKIVELEEDLDIEYTSNEIYDLLGGIEEGANRTRYVVRGLRTFSRLDEAVFKATDLLEGLDSTLSLLTNQTKNEVRIVRDFEAIPKVECNGSKMNQVFMNLLTNSIQALKENAEKGDDLEIKITAKAINGGNVQFSFKDNGPGISEENQKKIFEPFFTTKDVGKGTGLGLSIVFKVIDSHNGTIEINSEQGKGAEFLITLPIKNKPNENITK